MTPVIIGNARATRIYALCEFPSQKIRYIGKTVQPLRLRLAAHVRVSRKTPRLPVGRWIAKRERDGKNICIKWIETIDDSSGWAEREAYWIAFYRSNGERLLNLTSGGEGLPGHRFSNEHKERIAAALRTGDHFYCIECGEKFWRKPSEIKKNHNKFCSHQCSNRHNKGGHHAT